jgi:GT2 family glycosyltransferase
MRIQVGILSHNPGEMLERCLRSLIRIPAGIEYELKLQLTEGSNAENWNRLYHSCDADLICMLEDDTAAIRPLWLKSMVETMMFDPNCGVVMPIETKDEINPDPGFKQWMNKTSQIQQVYGFCCLWRRFEWLKADEKLTYFVDIDNGYQLQRKGYDALCNGHVMMLHGGPDRLSEDADIVKRQEKDRKYLIEKWGVKVKEAA